MIVKLLPTGTISNMSSFDNSRLPVDVCTLGMFIIDEIDYVNNKGSKTSIIGGAGTYVALGARLVAGKQNADSVGWIVDMGSDFPPCFKSTLDAWQTRCLFREDVTRLTTRAWNGFDENEERAFKYLTPKIRLEASSLPPALLFSKVFHVVCSGARCKQIVTEISDRRKAEAAYDLDAVSTRPIFVWEPIPDLCLPSELDAFWEAARLVDVVSPNEGELCGYFSASRMTDRAPGSDQTIAEHVVDHGIGPEGKGSLIVRAGKDGCVAFTPSCSLRLRPYYLPQESRTSNKRVVDPTGGGNTFLGGLCKALVGKTCPSKDQLLGWIFNGEAYDTETDEDSNRLHTLSSLVLANVAAGFAIEQQGMPTLSHSSGRELWNNEQFVERVREYIDRERDFILKQNCLK